MTVTMLTPDLRRILDDLARRLGILERRVNPNAPELSSSKHAHEGSGDYSTIVHPSTDTTGVASGESSVAVGDGATATADRTTAVGSYADASALTATAIGDSAEASHEGSTAIGQGAFTTATFQVMLGTGGVKTIQGVPNGALASAELGQSQMSFYLNEAGNLLTVKVKYSDATVKTGTIALV